jgi:hypothetical protein
MERERAKGAASSLVMDTRVRLGGGGTRSSAAWTWIVAGKDNPGRSEHAFADRGRGSKGCPMGGGDVLVGARCGDGKQPVTLNRS